MAVFEGTTDALWSRAANWVGSAKPGVGESVVIEATCTADEVFDVAGLTISPGYTLTDSGNLAYSASSIVQVDGTLALTGNQAISGAWSGSGAVTASAAVTSLLIGFGTTATWSTLPLTLGGNMSLNAPDTTLAAVTIVAGKTTTLSANLSCGALTITGTLTGGTRTITCTAFTVTASTGVKTGNGAVTCSGDVNIAGTMVPANNTGTFTHPNGGHIANANTNNVLANLDFGRTGTTTILDADVVCRKIALGNGTLTGANKTLQIDFAASEFWLNGVGTIDCNVYLQGSGIPGAVSNTTLVHVSGTVGNLTLSSVKSSDGSKSTTYVGGINAGAKDAIFIANFTSADANDIGRIIVSGPLTCGALKLGLAASDRSVELTLKGNVNVATVAKVYAGATYTVLNLSGCILSASGNVTLTGFTTTAAGAILNGKLAGTLTGLSGWLKAYGTTNTPSAVVRVTPPEGIGLNTMMGAA